MIQSCQNDNCLSLANDRIVSASKIIITVVHENIHAHSRHSINTY